MAVFDRVRRRVVPDDGFIGELRATTLAVTGTGTVEARQGWLYCNGAAISRTVYKRLFDRIGTTYGAGDGSTTFNLPDYRGQVLSFAADGQATGGGTNRMAATAGAPAGVESYALAAADTPRHTHGPGTLAVAAGGAHVHGQNFTANSDSGNSGSPDSNVRCAWQGGTSTQTGSNLFGGTSAAATHGHPSSEFSGATENGAADGLPASVTAHSNVPPVQGCSVMVRY